MAEFDRYSECFRDTVQKAVDYGGKSSDFYMQIKVQHMQRIVERHFGMTEGLEILDVGCGIGRAETLMRNWRCTVVGVDISDKMIEVARRNNSGFSYSAFDGETLPFEEGVFDVVFAICVFHHVDCAMRKNLVQEFTRVLKPGGLVILYEHNPYNPLTQLTVLRCEFDKDASLLTKRESEWLLNQVCCHEIRSEFILLLPSSSKWVRKMEAFLYKVPLGAQYCTYGVKPVLNGPKCVLR